MTRCILRVVAGITLMLLCASAIGCKNNDADSESVNYTRDFIERYRPATFRPMKFGVYVEYASYLYIRNYTTEQILQEIDLYNQLGVDIFRFDVRYDHWLNGDQESIAKIEQAVNEVRSRGKLLWLSIYGVEAWNGAALDDYGSASWEDWKDMVREETRLVITTYHPDYLTILPEAPRQRSTMPNPLDWMDSCCFRAAGVYIIPN